MPHIFLFISPRDFERYRQALIADGMKKTPFDRSVIDRWNKKKARESFAGFKNFLYPSYVFGEFSFNMFEKFRSWYKKSPSLISRTRYSFKVSIHNGFFYVLPPCS